MTYVTCVTNVTKVTIVTLHHPDNLVCVSSNRTRVVALDVGGKDVSR